MSVRNRIPPLLEPYIRLPPEASLILLTGVLDATPNWLTVRYLSGFLGDKQRHGGTRAGQSTAGTNVGYDGNEGDGAVNQEDEQQGTAVVLVSWMRDWEFWKAEARRGAGLDLARLAQSNRFAFVDGLTSLFSPAPATATASAQPNPAPPAPTQPPRASVARTPIPARTPTALPIRSSPAARNTPSSPPTPTPTPAPAPAQPPHRQPLQTPTLAHAASTISSAISSLHVSNRKRRIILVLDAPTLLLSTASATAAQLSTFMLQMREQVHSTLAIAEADGAFLRSAGEALEAGLRGFSGAGAAGAVGTPLEAEHAAFVVAQAHAASWVVGVRGLDTGVARDVSGVLRVGRGGGWDGEEDGERDVAGEMEVLYHVQADGGVKVFERGGGNVG